MYSIIFYREFRWKILRDWSKSTGGGGGWAGAEGGWVTMFSALPMGWVMLF